MCNDVISCIDWTRGHLQQRYLLDDLARWGVAPEPLCGDAAVGPHGKEVSSTISFKVYEELYKI